MPDTETTTLTEEQVSRIVNTVTDNAPLQRYLAEFDIDVPALCRSLRAAWAERNEAYVSERENCNMLEQLNVQLTTGLVNIYHVITNEHCKHGVALGMATSAVSSMLSEITALRAQNRTQAESIIEFQKQLKEAHANVESLSQIIFRSEHATAMRDACVEKLRGLRHKSEPDDSRWNAALYHAEKQIESLTIDQVQEKP